MNNQSRGWGSPALARKAHYFVDAFSLCRRWAFTGFVSETDHSHAEKCSACERALAKRSESENT